MLKVRIPMALWLVVWLAVWPAPSLPAADPTILQIKVLSGEGAAFVVGSTTARAAEVLVTDENGQPVEGAAVSFLLPEEGPSGVFAGGLRTDVSLTGKQGRAVAAGVRWNGETGPVQLRITAVKGSARAGAIATLHLTQLAGDRTVILSPVPEARVGLSRKWLLLGLAAAAAVGAGVALGVSGSSTAAPPAAAVAGPQIGAPSIVISKP